MVISEGDISKMVLACVRNIVNEKFNYAGMGDEFYTRYRDIEKELKNYDFSGKIVYCNCDNPKMSQFYRYFKQNYHDLKLKGLYATYYSDNPMVFYFNGTNETTRPITSGRFQDNTEIMKKCDIVVTNPPFSESMPSRLVNMAKKLGKHVIIVAPNTIATNNDMFNLIKNGQLNMGHSTIGTFNRPDGTTAKAPTSWWTTLPLERKPFSSGVKYNPNNYEKYDNYNAIDIKDCRQIPDDYYGDMGVSPNFLKYLNRQQFDIVGKIRPILNGRPGFSKYIIRRKKDGGQQ